MDSTHQDSAADAPATPAGGVGARLRAAREALRLELTHIAAETRIPLRHLEAIEGGAFETLPSRAYAIGFARTFAKAVRLDGQAIADAVRLELADGPMRRAAPPPEMQPGDPARLPSAGLAWAAAFAAFVLMVGAFSFYHAYFGAGTGPASLVAPDPSASAAAAGAGQRRAAAAPAPSGAVVLTATEEGVWLRLYEEGGERLLERTLAAGEAVTVPAAATDPRINTGRPDALAVTIGGQSVAKLAEKPVNMSGVPVSAAALLARGPAAAASPAPGGVPARRPAARRAPVTGPAAAAPEASGSEPASASAPSPPPPAADAAPASGDGTPG